jgi:flavin prenyltransferase
MKILLGISGASGAPYGVRLGEVLLAHGVDLSVIVTKTGWELLAAEIDGPPPPSDFGGRAAWLGERMGSSGAKGTVRLFAEDDFRIPYASGSNPPDAVVVAPCSMGFAGRVAHGLSGIALERCVDVALKERKRVVLVARETPLSTIHLENLLTLSRAGAVVLPAAPGFYHRPTKASDLIDFVVDRIARTVGLDAHLLPRWGEGNG